jgi:hypothetical protein
MRPLAPSRRLFPALVVVTALAACAKGGVGVDANAPTNEGTPRPPATLDTDGDGIPDAQEDRDNDGTVDPGETDPEVKDTDNDGIPDADEVDAIACGRERDRPIKVYDVPGADAMLLVDAAVSERALLFEPGGRNVGLAVADPALGVAAVLVGRPLTAGVTTPDAARERARREVLAVLGAVQNLTARSFTTHDGFAAEQASFQLVAGAPTDARALLALAARGLVGAPMLRGELVPGGMADRTMTLQLLTIVRGTRVVHVLAGAAGDAPADPQRIRLEELTDGTNVARHGAFTRHVCDQLEAVATAKADILFVVDDSGSMEDDQDAVRRAADAMGDVLRAARVDFRLGVARMFASDRDSRQRGALEGRGLSDDLSTFRDAIVVGANGGWEPGLETGILAIDRLLPRTAVGAPADPRRLREDAATIVIHLSDERDQESECSACGRCDYDQSPTRRQFCAGGQDVIERYVTAYTQRKAVTFALVGDLPDGCRQTQSRDDFEPGQGYVEVASRTGGRFGSLCGDMRQNLDAIARVATGVASTYRLSARPASASLRVAIGPPGQGREVRRSRVDGYDYDPAQNSVVFYGAARPTEGDEVRIGYRRWDFAGGPGDPLDPCEGCAPGTACDAASDDAACRPRCGLEICADGLGCNLDVAACGPPTSPSPSPSPTDRCGGRCAAAGRVCDPIVGACVVPCSTTGCAAPLRCHEVTQLCDSGV